MTDMETVGIREEGTMKISAFKKNSPTGIQEKGSPVSIWLKWLKPISLLVLLLITIGFQLSFLFTRERTGIRILICGGLFFRCLEIIQMIAMKVSAFKKNSPTGIQEKSSPVSIWLKWLKPMSLLVLLLINTGFQLSLLLTQERTGIRILICAGLFFGCHGILQIIVENMDVVENSSEGEKYTRQQLIGLVEFAMSLVMVGFTLGLHVSI